MRSAGREGRSINFQCLYEGYMRSAGREGRSINFQCLGKYVAQQQPLMNCTICPLPCFKSSYNDF